MPAPTVKGKSRKWLLYAAGAGVLLALIFLLRKKTPSPEAAPAGAISAPENLASTGEGVGSAVAPAAAPTLNLGGPLNPGESVSARSANSGGEVEASRAREAGENAGLTPDQVKAAETAAYHRGVEKVKKQDREKAAAAKAKAAAPKKPSPKPHKGKAKPAPVVAKTKAQATTHGGRHHKAAPKPHKTRR